MTLVLTLHRYLAKDLIRIALLAATALTLVMTTFAIIEPLRQQGLSPGQALQLFWYTMPAMLSLTLPIAALFAATIVYGRFATDNELTACRASGVSTFSLMKPGLIMGLVVTILSLLLSNWVAPTLLQRGKQVVEANLKGVVYQRLRTNSHLKWETKIIYADEVDAQADTLRGVVFVSLDSKTPRDARYVVARQAYVDFYEEAGSPSVVTFTLDHPFVGRQGNFSMAEQGQQTYEYVLDFGALKENTGFYDWKMLCEVWMDPQKSTVVKRQLTKIKRDLYGNNLYDEMAEAFKAGQSCQLTANHEDRYVFRAPTASVDNGKHLVMRAAPAGGPVVIEVYNKANTLTRTMKCQRAELRAEYVMALKDHQVTLDLFDVEVITPGDSAPPIHREDYTGIGPLDMPSNLRGAMPNDILALYQNPQLYPSVKGSIAQMNLTIRDLKRKILAEMHGRVAYGIGCFLLVAIGGALGLLFRGGQILSAFGLSCIPAMVLIILTIMGKQLIGNPGVNPIYGLLSIWSGVAILLLVSIYVYAFPLRR